jgi:predicted ATPase
MVGRDGDLEAVVAALRDPSRPVVTLTGPGGVGKTTLAVAAAARAGAAFPGGVVVVELADVTAPEAVLAAVAGALGVPEVGFAGTVAELVPYVEGRRVLLLLDNLEQVLDCAADVAALVRHCPDLVVLATSRAPLKIRSEQEVRVAPLDDAAAVELFLERLGGAGPLLEDAPEVTELCRRLEGLPLALELAASAAGALGHTNLLDRLATALRDGPRDLPERQRSMSATLDWSLGLVAATDRQLLERLSVLPGTFTLAAADAVSGGPALPELRRLVEHSLVTRAGEVRGTTRFRLLEPVRQHVAGQLPAAVRSQVEAGVVSYASRLATSLTEHLKGADAATALDLLEADFGLVRIAFHRLVDEARYDDAADLSWRLWLFLALRGHGREGLTWFSRLDGSPLGDVARIRWNIARAGLDYLVGDIARQRQLSEAALTLALRVGRPDLAAEAAVLAASGALFAGDLGAARVLLDSGWREIDGARERWLHAHAMIVSGQVALLARDPDAEQSLLDAVAAARAVGNPFTLATALNVLATLTALHEEHARTAALLAESVTLSIEARMSWTLAYTLPALAGVAVRLGRASSGVRLFGASASYSAQHHVAANFQASRELADSDLAAAREQLGEAEFRAAWDAGRDASGAHVVDLARDLIRGEPG